MARLESSGPAYLPGLMTPAGLFLSPPGSLRLEEGRKIANIPLTSRITVRSLDTFSQTASSRIAACGVVVAGTNEDHNSVFSSNHTTLGLSFAPAVRNTAEKSKASDAPVCCSSAKHKGTVEVLYLFKATRNRSVSPGQECKQFTSGQHVQSVRRTQDAGYHKHPTKSHEMEWLERFIDPSESKHFMRMTLDGSAMISINS